MGRGQKPYFQLDFSTFSKIVLGLPAFGFFFCVIWSLYFDFKASTATHCKVWQFLPSISSCIGGFSPQRYVWRICIGLHCAPRFMLAVAYYNYHTQIHIEHWFYQKLAALCTVLHIIENFSLVCTHENMFIIFMISSQFYMLFTCIIYKWGLSSLKSVTNSERKSLKYKIILFVFNVTSFFVAVYLFFRHNWYCERGVQSLFAMD
ncbi:hypothetical protein KUTeg_024653 [Tegillarca granosa]|uniref:CWH43-like N-terminal domain-containing protein n=1 Tax=Tegillarca granosa TaxID=220873 RepID=A0ABQ9E3G2_TEGGR|nr:hypothetical protein KUTeg_024653 [Tegillarca granosa]